MSSPETHSGTPKDPDIEPNLKEYLEREGGYAYSAETDDGDSSPEIVPYDSERDQDVELARDTLSEVQQLWDEVDKETRAAVWYAMTDVINIRVAKNQAEHEMNNIWNPRLEKLREEHSSLMATEKAQKDADTNKNKINSRKLQNIRRKRLLKGGELQRAEREMKQSQKDITDAPELARKSDKVKNTLSYKSLITDLERIEEAIKERDKTRALLKNISPDDPRRAELEAQVDVSDEVFRAQEQKAAGEKYRESLKVEKEEEKHTEWEKAFPYIKEQLQDYSKNETTLSDTKSSATDKALIQATQLERGDREEFRRTLMEQVAPNELDSVVDHYRNWLKEQDQKKYDEDIAEAKSKTQKDRVETTQQYFQLKQTALRIAGGEITDDKAKAENEKALRDITAQMEAWPEWAAFTKQTVTDPTDFAPYKELLIDPYYNKLVASIEQRQIERLRKSGY